MQTQTHLDHMLGTLINWPNDTSYHTNRLICSATFSVILLGEYSGFPQDKRITINFAYGHIESHVHLFFDSTLVFLVSFWMERNKHAVFAKLSRCSLHYLYLYLSPMISLNIICGRPVRTLHSRITVSDSISLIWFNINVLQFRKQMQKIWAKPCFIDYKTLLVLLLVSSSLILEIVVRCSSIFHSYEFHE